MVITPHILVGAAIGSKIKKIGWIIILGLLSHLVLDMIPHWDYGNSALKKFTKTKSYKILFKFFGKLAIDGFIGGSIIFTVVWQKNIFSPDDLLFILIGIMAGFFPDFLLGTIKLLAGKMPKFSKAYSSFNEKYLHCQIHIKKPTLLGVGTQVIISLIAILILIL